MQQYRAERPPAMSERTWRKFTSRPGNDAVDFLLGANCSKVSLIEDGRVVATVLRTELITILTHKSSKPQGERWLIRPEDDSVPFAVFISLAHRVACALGENVQIPVRGKSFTVKYTSSFQQAVDGYRALYLHLDGI